MRYLIVFVTFGMVQILSLSDTAAQIAVYDPNTGSIVLNGITGDLGGLRINSSLTGGSDELIPQHVNDFPPEVGAIFFIDDENNQSLSWLFFGSTGVGPHDLGRIAAPNLLQSTLDTNYLFEFRIKGSAPEYWSLAITGGLIPEPSSVLLASIALVGLVMTGRLW